ncbi:MAG: aminotransferase class IV, partial [Planctomycetales bacterium]
MKQPIAYRNGDFLPFAELHIAPNDRGFVQGAATAEQLRTFNGRLFQWNEHWKRLRRSLEILGLENAIEEAELVTAADRLVTENYPLASSGSDLGLSIVVTPGAYASFVSEETGPTVLAHTYPLPHDRWTSSYRDGVELATVGVQQVPPECWPAELKCRSRMHYYLAEREAAQSRPGAVALLLDATGAVRETSTANLLLCNWESDAPVLVSPPREFILPGVSLGFVHELSKELGWKFTERELTVDDVHAHAVAPRLQHPLESRTVLSDGASIQLGDREQTPGRAGQPSFVRFVDV